MIPYLDTYSGTGTGYEGLREHGFTPLAFAEIEPFACEVLKQRYPEIPNAGDVTKIDPREYRRAKLVIGGPPCQSFSNAGKRKSLKDARGQQTIKYAELINEISPEYAIYENVDDILGADGNAFGVLLGILAGSDGPVPPSGRFQKSGKNKSAKWPRAGVVLGPARTVAWRVLDSQYFGVPQRRRRVFVVASSREGRAAEVLFEPNCGPRYPEKSGGKKAPVRSAAGSRADNRGERRRFLRSVLGSMGLAGRGGNFPDTWLGGEGEPESPLDFAGMGAANRGPVGALTKTGVGTCGADDNQAQAGHLIVVRGDSAASTPSLPTLTKKCGRGGENYVVIPWTQNQSGNLLTTDVFPAVCRNGNATGRNSAKAVIYDFFQLFLRRLTPEECEALQGLKAGHTKIRWKGKSEEECPDGPRYAAIGEGYTRQVISWIGQRLLAVERYHAERDEESFLNE